MATKEAVKPPLVSKPGRKVHILESGKRILIDEERHEVFVDSAEISIAPKEFKILLVLKQSGKTMSRQDILRAVWSNGKHLDERTVDQHIARLRRKLSAAGVLGTEVIKTQNSFGYVYKAV